MAGTIDYIRGEVDRISDLLDQDPAERVLSDRSIASLAIDYFNAVWPIIQAASEEWWPDRTNPDPGERALIDALCKVDGDQPSDEDAESVGEE